MGILSAGFECSLASCCCNDKSDQHFSDVQVLATQNDHEPMVAFICGKPAMHKGVNDWISDETTKECWDDKRPILNYCRKVSTVSPATCILMNVIIQTWYLVNWTFLVFYQF